MLYGAEINGVNTLDEYGLMLCADLKIGEPKLKQNLVDIPGGDGALNMSYSPQGRAVYEMRAISFSLFKPCVETERETLVNTLRNLWHGQVVKLVLPNDTTHYWQGILAIGDISGYNKGVIPVSMIAEPYKYATDGTVVEWSPDDVESGDIVTFEAGGEYPLSNVSFPLAPIQDLHGYDAPWPAGGGKNKLDIEERTLTTYGGQEDFLHIYCEGCTATKSGGSFTVTNTGSWSKLRFKFDTSKLINGQTYTLSALFTNPNAQILLAGYNNGSWHVSNSSTASSVRQSITFTYDSSWTSLTLACITNNTSQATNKTVTVSEIQLELGSTATSYAPYSNICPISGHSSVNVIVSPTLNKSDGTTYPIPLGQTVYGGTLDVTTGKLTVDRVSFSVLLSEATSTSVGENTARFSFTAVFANTLIGNASGANKTMCSITNRYAYNTNDSVHYYVSNAGSAFLWLPKDINTSTEIQIVATLATPIVYDLAPQDIATILGQNNVWADTGEISLPLPYVTLTNERKAVTPTINAAQTATITFDGTSVSVSAGESVIPQLVLDSSSKEVGVASMGAVTFSYREGSL